MKKKIFSKIVRSRILTVLMSVTISLSLWLVLRHYAFLPLEQLATIVAIVAPATISWVISTERIKYEKELQRQKDELEQLNELNSNLFATLTHDVRSPILQVKTISQMYNSRKMGVADLDLFAKGIEFKSIVLLEFIDDILKWSKKQIDGNGLFEISTFDVRGVIDNLIVINQYNITKKNIRLHINVQCEKIRTDKDIYMMVVRNVLQNAVKYTPEKGRIYITVYDTGQFIKTEIKDNGVGMSAEVQNSIYNNGKIDSAEGTAKEKGSGLGLKMCFKYIEILNGRLTINSSLGKGTTVTLDLPNINTINKVSETKKGVKKSKPFIRA